jgi:hypothetical protein
LDILSRLSGGEIETPAAVTQRRVTICSLSGMAAGPSCPATREEFVSAAIERCTFHSAEGRPPEYPPAYAPWLRIFERNGTTREKAELRITTPVDGAVFYFDYGAPPGAQAIRVEALHGADPPPELYVNGKPAPGRTAHPGHSSWLLPLSPGVLRLEVTDGIRADSRRIEVR